MTDMLGTCRSMANACTRMCRQEYKKIPLLRQGRQLKNLKNTLADVAQLVEQLIRNQ